MTPKIEILDQKYARFGGWSFLTILTVKVVFLTISNLFGSCLGMFGHRLST